MQMIGDVLIGTALPFQNNPCTVCHHHLDVLSLSRSPGIAIEASALGSGSRLMLISTPGLTALYTVVDHELVTGHELRRSAASKTIESDQL